MRIRPKIDTDTAACAVLLTLTHHLDNYPQYLPDKPEAFVTSAAELAAWVVEIDGEIVGHVAVHRAEGDPTYPAAQAATGLPPDRLAVVARLMVHPSVRRRGLARRLLEAATTHADQHDLRLVLDVRRQSFPAIVLYESLGWRRIAPLALTIDQHLPLELWVYLAPEATTRRGQPFSRAMS